MEREGVMGECVMGVEREGVMSVMGECVMGVEREGVMGVMGVNVLIL